MHQPTSEILLQLGFVDIAKWIGVGSELDYRLDGPNVEVNKVRLDERNALYAFVHDENVKYIGKTSKTLRKRFYGYKKPGKTQITNVRCNKNIKLAIELAAEIRIFLFTPISYLRYLDFEINLAAGLEDSLIAAFDPPWNGREKGLPITEEAEREEAEDVTYVEAPLVSERSNYVSETQAISSFTIALGEAYYRQGIINPGVGASRCLGKEGEPIEICFSDGADSVVSRIDRKANSSGSVRVMGRNRQIADWFQRNFKAGEIVEARVLDAHRILLIRGDRIVS